eukprot:TRINITY_DN34155_c0_g1_i1.p1 TRINITY_DN34155_c0_g1~~TRINITY_DN34155_c0_g1_i1.p1  ORF type:complete len:231 (-),score=29.99 TRINITY_DN34155_c0_g1_i1:112-756(-)
MSEDQRRQLQFFFTFEGEAAALNEETSDILVFGTTLPFIAIIGAVAPYLAYVGVGVRDAQLGGTSLLELGNLNVRLATSQFAIALIGVVLFITAIVRASPEVRYEFKDKTKAGVLASETVKLVGDLTMSEIMIKTIMPGVLVAALFLSAFLMDGFGRALREGWLGRPEVPERVCNAVRSLGTQAKVIGMARLGDTGAAQSTFDLNAKELAGIRI